MLITKKCHLFVVTLLIAITLSSCAKFMSPPTVQEVESKFNQNREDIMIVTNYLAESEYGRIYLHDTSGNMSVGTSNISISDQIVIDSIKRLSLKGYTVIIKDGNTIHFQQWTRFTDAGCGIAYSINKTSAPRIEFLTQLEPLSEEGWYYYVDDYAQWRVEQGQSS